MTGRTAALRQRLAISLGPLARERIHRLFEPGKRPLDVWIPGQPGRANHVAALGSLAEGLDIEEVSSVHGRGLRKYCLFIQYFSASPSKSQVVY